MKFENYLDAVKVVNPLLLSETELKVKVTTIEAILQDAYRHGYEQAKEEGSVFEQLFGKGKL